MKRNYFIWFVICSVLMLSGNSVYAQISEGGLPPSFNYPQKPDLTAKLKSSRIVPVTADIDQLRKEDAERELENLPPRATVIIPVDMDINHHGEWSLLPDGQRIWTLNIKAEGAIASMLYYNEFFIPEGGKLFIYNAERTHILGAYTTRTNPTGRKFATELVAGDELILEYVAPLNFGSIESSSLLRNIEEARIKISAIGYGYNYIQVHYPSKNKFMNVGGSFSCHVNINCPEGADWQLEKKGIAFVLSQWGPYGFLSSGTLINNTRNDSDPLFLSAFHCFSAPDQLGVIDQTLFYFHYEHPDCENLNETPTTTKTMVGGEILVNLPLMTAADGCLLRLLDPIPPDYNVYYNGWDRRNIPATSGVGIHHPNGDVKKISTFTNPVQHTTWGQSQTTDGYWAAKYVKTVSGFGIVEGGSSGSPLFNQDKRVVGTATGSNGATCESLQAYVTYGKLWHHWDQVPGEGNQMATYLDPINTGEEFIDGILSLDVPQVDFWHPRGDIFAGDIVRFVDHSWLATTYHWTFEDGVPNSFEGKEPPLIRFNALGDKRVQLIINAGTPDERVKEITLHVIAKPGTAFPSAKFAFSSSVVLEEDFESDFKQGWDTEGYGELPNRTWMILGLGGTKYDFSHIDPTSQYQAMVLPEFSNRVNTWLKSPEVNIQENTWIEFYVGYDKIGLTNLFDMELTFHISENNGQSWEKIWSTDETEPDEVWEWRKKTFDLSAYNGKDIRFAWQYEGIGGDFVGLDGIKVVHEVTKKTIQIEKDYIKVEDLSSGLPLQWEWTFEGAQPATSTDQDPGKIYYHSLGTFDIILTIKNYLGEDTYVLPGAVTVIPIQPVAGFIVEEAYTNLDYQYVIPPGSSLNFTDISTHEPSTWNWTFEGGQPAESTEQHPAGITYNLPGEYSVRLEVANPDTIFSIDRPNTIKVTNTDRVWNMLPGESGLSTLEYGAYYLTGSNTLFSSVFAERFDAPVSKISLESIDIMFYKESQGSSTLTVYVYQEENGYPGNIIQSFELPVEDIQEEGYTTITLPEPILIEEAFYIGVGNFYMNEGMNDIVAIKSSEFRGTETETETVNKNTVYVYSSLFTGGLSYQWMTMEESLLYRKSISMNIVPQITYITEDTETVVSMFDNVSPYIEEAASVEPPITLSPNPATNRVYIQINEEAKIEMISLNGQKVKEVLLPSSGFVDISQLSGGIYFVRIVSNNEAKTLKLIKK